MTPYVWKPGRNFLGRRFFALTRYETYEQITPGRRFGQLDGFDPELADGIQRELIARFGMNGTPPPRPEPNQTVDHWLRDLERWWFHNNITEQEAVWGLDDGDGEW